MLKVSVIIPVRDDEVRLRACVDCLTGSVEHLQEIIIVDNGSQHRVSQTWFASPLVKVLRCPDHGSYAARNIGIAAAVGNILAFTDSDCLPAKDWVSAAAKIFATTRARVVAGHIVVFPQDPERPTPVEYYEMLFAFPQKTYVHRSQFGVTANLFVRREVFDDVGLFNNDLFSGGDREWGRRASRRGHTIHFDDTVVVRHPARRTFGELSTKARRVALGLVQGGDSVIERSRLEKLASSGMPPIRNVAYAVLKSQGAPLPTRMRTGVVIMRLHYENLAALRTALAERPRAKGFEAESGIGGRASAEDDAPRIDSTATIKPRLLVVTRAYDVFSEIWIQRQIAAFERFETTVLCWEALKDSHTPTLVPVHVLDADFAKMEREISRWGRRLLALPGGNLHGTVGNERRQIEDIVRGIAPDVMLCHFGHTALRLLPVAETLGIPLVAHFHGTDISSSLRDHYYRWSLSHAAKYFAESIVVGSHQQRRLCGLGVPASAISLIPCGAPTDQFLPKTDYQTPGCTFIAVSRLVPWKGLDFTIRAFSRAQREHPHMELHIVGAGAMEMLLRRLAITENLGEMVVFHGVKSSDEVRRLMVASDVFVQHSLDYATGWEEGFGVSITEASACGLPVVVTDSGGIPDQITDGENGFITPQRDIDSMAERMIRLARDQALRERLGRAGRERAISQFDSTILAHKLEDRLLNAAGRPTAVAETAEAVQ